MTGSYCAPVFLALATAAAGLTYLVIGPELMRLATPVEGYDVGRMLLLHSKFPRLVCSLLAGAALALSGTILQQALRNPLASPTTMGVSAGGYLALILASLFAPSLLAFSRELVALTGSGLAALLVFGLVARRDFAPVTLVLAGLIVSLYCGAMAVLLLLFNDQYLVSLFIWGAGSLSQQDWSIVTSIAPKLALFFLLAILLAKPLSLLQLGEEGAKSLGLSPARLRVLAVALAVGLAAIVTSAVGVISFIGLVAPTIARLAGARRIGSQLFWSPLIGAALLWFTDQGVQILVGSLADFLPTGAVTALFGSPLLLLLLPRLKLTFMKTRVNTIPKRWQGPTLPPILLAAAILTVIAILSLVIGRAPDGRWVVEWSGNWDIIAEWRLPRVLAAVSGGLMLALAGTILQRLTDNEMASPEVLGINAGAMLGMGAGLFIFTSPGYSTLMVCATVGASLILAGVFTLNRRSGFQPERMVLAGVALGALLDSFVGAVAASGDIRSIQMLRWQAGSTYDAANLPLGLNLGVAALLTIPAFLALRWLDLMALGATTATALGLPVRQARFLLFGIAALLTAAATLTVGPLTFVGLMAPHIARSLGFHRALPQLAMASLTGAMLMVIADWIGRNLNYPYEMPAGILSALVGTPLLLFLLRGQAPRNSTGSVGIFSRVFRRGI